MKKNLAFAAVILSLIFSACSKDPLYYEYDMNYNVHVNIDWTKAHINPNGASVYVYNMDGTLFRHMAPFSNPNSGIIRLPAGDYRILIFSDTPEEYSDFINFIGMDHWQTASAQTIYDEARDAEAREQAARDQQAREQAARESTDSTRSEKSEKVQPNFVSTRGTKGIMVGDAEIGEYVKTPDTLAAARIDSFHVTGTDIEYYTTNPDGFNVLNTNDVSNEISMTADRVVKNYQFAVHVKGLKYAKGQTETDLVGVSKGYYLGRGSNMEVRATHTFILNNRKYDEGSDKNGVITGSQLSFGLLPGTDNRYYLVIHFVLTDNTDYPITVDITDFLTKSESTYIDLDLELPYAEDMTGEVNVGGWSDEHQELTL